MRPKRWFSKPLLTEIAGWLCLLAVLALVALATSGVLEAVLTLAAVIAAVVAAGRSRGTRSALSERERAPLLLALAPALIGLVIAAQLVPDEWYAFTAVAIAFPLMLIWRDVYGRWQDRRASQHPA